MEGVLKRVEVYLSCAAQKLAGHRSGGGGHFLVHQLLSIFIYIFISIFLFLYLSKYFYLNPRVLLCWLFFFFLLSPPSHWKEGVSKQFCGAEPPARLNHNKL